jgi:thioesterase domain-containing protein
MVQTQPRASRIVELLLPIWQRVLRRTPIKVDDNFFDLGGNPTLAEQLFAEAAKICGHAFPAVCIYHMVTPATMASVLESTDKLKFEPPALMRTGSQEPPVFLAHGIGANILDFFDLVKHIRTNRPIYAIQSRGIYGVERPHERVEDMAEYHLDAITKTQKIGPYFLIGYSLGGLIMLEVARKLLASEKQIALLVLIDSYPDRTYLKFGQQVQLYSRLSMRKLFGLVQSQSKKPALASVTPNEDSLDGTNNAAVLDLSRQAEKKAAYAALKNYEPRFYGGKIRFIRAEILTRFPADANAVWGPLAGKLQIENIESDHLGMVGTNFKTLASMLSRYIAESDAN